jgi:hypothetical protein
VRRLREANHGNVFTEIGISQVVCLEAHPYSASMGPAGVNVPDDRAWL